MDNLVVEIMADPTSRWFLTILASLFIAFLAALLLRAQRTTRRRTTAVHIAPTLLATIGVIGTFAGIFLGLREFDVTNIDASVPILLEGLKTAFITSLAGMTLSVLFRFITMFFPAASTGTGENIFEELRNASLSMIDELRETRKANEASLQALHKAIGGEEDTSLASQFKHLRTDTRDCLKSIDSNLTEGFRTSDELSATHHELSKSAFDDFAKHMVDNTHSALIEALESVIRDFNQQLTDQFGENFKALNAGVESLVGWQENYKSHVETMEERIKATVEALESSAEALKSVDNSASHIPKALEPLQPVLNTLDTGLTRLNEDLKAFGDLGEKASDALPLINKNLESITEQCRVAIDTMTARNSEALERQKVTHETLESGYATMREQAVEQQRAFQQSIMQIVGSTESEFKRAAQESSSSMDAVWKDVRKHLTDQVIELDEQLGKELGQALNIMSKNLGGMSEQFVKDYDPLVKQLAEVVSIANRVDRFAS